MGDDPVSQKKPHNVVAVSYEWPGDLRTADDACRLIRISAERLRQLADSGYAPHYRIDGGESLFRAAELKRWAAEHLVIYNDGRELPETVRIVAPPDPVRDHRKVPKALREVEGLGDITAYVRRSGIYFICHESVLLYIGKSVNAAGRLSDHHMNPTRFDSVFFLPWPADDLNRIEGALIRALRPPLNGTTPNGNMIAPSARTKKQDAEIAAKLGVQLELMGTMEESEKALENAP